MLDCQQMLTNFLHAWDLFFDTETLHRSKLKMNFEPKIVNIFWTSVLCPQKNRLIETVLLSTYNTCFGYEIRKFIFNYTFDGPVENV